MTNVLIFYNWVKQQQYTIYIHAGDSIVNLGSNSGVDTYKLRNQSPSRVLNLDIDSYMIKQGLRQTQEEGLHNFHWRAMDLMNPQDYEKLIREKILHVPNSINVFTCQDTLAHLFKSREIIVNFLDWIYTFLRPGGYFLGSMPDGDLLIEREKKKSKEENKIELKESTIKSYTIRDFGHEISKMEGDISMYPKYLVYFPLLVKHAEEIGFKLIKSEMFEDLYKKYPNSNLDPKEMKFSFIYRSFVFQKI